MLIGIPKETRTGENRVAIIPAGVPELLEAGYEVIVEADGILTLSSILKSAKKVYVSSKKGNISSHRDVVVILMS